jgi:hypothetical protein
MIGNHQLGRARWRGCAQVSNEIGNGEIDLVTHWADDRNGTARNRAGGDLLIE